MKIQFSLARTYELTLKLIYLHKLFFINSKISQSKQTPSLTLPVPPLGKGHLEMK